VASRPSCVLGALGGIATLLEFYAAFVAATITLMILQGPNVGLITANSISYGGRFGLVTVQGTSPAMVL
jgi:homoserine/homoserine lactone efflux protein